MIEYKKLRIARRGEQSMDEKTRDRVGRMEAALDRSIAATAALGRALDEMEALREEMTALFAYYGSADWFADRELPLPPGIRAGVLSEDLVYDEITDLRGEAFRMLTLATEILRDRI
jgi:hypothetical protein